MNVKTVFIIISIAWVCMSCVKRKNCDCENGGTGTFVYLKEPYKIRGVCSNKKEKIVAHFFYDGWTIPVEVKEGSGGVPIRGDVPSSFRSGEQIKVNVCLKGDCGDGIRSGKIIPIGTEIHSLKCIERKEE